MTPLKSEQNRSTVPQGIAKTTKEGIHVMKFGVKYGNMKEFMR